MATDDAISELAAVLPPEEVPIKLRCVTCSLIAYNALRLPCCEQNICETCYNELEDVCQVCHHEPLDKSLCTPNKSLRTTTKVFLKRKLLERSKEQKKQQEATSFPQPGASVENIKEQSSVAAGSSAGTSLQTPTGNVVKHSINADHDAETVKAGEDTPIAVNEAVLQPQQGGAWEQQEAKEIGERDAESSARQNGGWPADGAQAPTNPIQNPNQVNGTGNLGGFPMDMSAMMAMGGMPNMMGMGMDPMMMNAMASSMFGGFGGPNMGMNGMSMGIGQGQFGGPWMGDNSDGNFGNQAGYNMPSHQGNFHNRQHYSHNDFHNGYGRQAFYSRGRGRGRGRGYYGGYGHHQQGHMNQGNYSYGNNSFRSNHVQNEQTWAASDPQDWEQPANEAGAPQDDGSDPQPSRPVTSNDADAPVGKDVLDEMEEDEDQPRRDSKEVDSIMLPDAQTITSDANNDAQPLPIQTFISDERQPRNMIPHRNNGPSGAPNRFQDTQRPAGTSVDASGPAKPRVVGVPGAPTGPRALREGRPNTGWSGIPTNGKVSASGAASGSGNQASRSPTLVNDMRRSKSRSRTQSRSPVRSRSRDDKGRRPSRRPHSRSPVREDQVVRHEDQHEGRDHHDSNDMEIAEDGQSQGRESRRRRRRHEREREISGHRRRHSRSDEHSPEDPQRRYDERDAGEEYDAERDRARERRHDDRKDRYRRHRSRTLSRERDDPYANEPTGSGESKKRRHRDDNRENDYRHEHDHDRHERRHRKRSRRDRSSSRDRSARHPASSRDESKANTPITPSFPPPRRESSAANPSNRPPTGPSGRAVPTGPKSDNIRIRGCDSRRSRHHKNDVEDAPKAPEKDPHTLEREARDRERLVKEMQRRATFEGGRTGNGDGRRRSGVKYEDDNRKDARRVEKEREGRRR